MAEKSIWLWIFDSLAGLLAKQDLARAGATPEQLSGAKVITIPLGSGYDREMEENEQRRKIVEFLRSQNGKPYRLGTEIPDGKEWSAEDWDCSELGEAGYRVAGLHMPDGSNYQYDHCSPVLYPKAGDPSFLWSDKWGRIGHVMYYTGDGTVVHAVGGRGVVEDPIEMWTNHARFRGWRRHPDFSRPVSERSV